jgi:hypothetical protein
MTQKEQMQVMFVYLDGYNELVIDQTPQALFDWLNKGMLCGLKSNLELNMLNPNGSCCLENKAEGKKTFGIYFQAHSDPLCF